MISLEIERFCYASFGTFGQMIIDGRLVYTVERPWINNKVLVSCIPEGVYDCSPRRFYHGGYEAIEIKDVPGRSYILFHKANLPEQLGGCIAPVTSLGCLYDKWAGLGSGAAFKLLMDHYGEREFKLMIGANPHGPES